MTPNKESDPRGVRPRLEGKPRTPLSSRVATGISWSPLSGLKGVKPPEEFLPRIACVCPGVPAEAWVGRGLLHEAALEDLGLPLSGPDVEVQLLGSQG